MTNEGNQVVVGVDGSASARDAARWAGAVAQRCGWPLHILHALPDFAPHFTEFIGDTPDGPTAHLRDTGDAILESAAEAVRADCRDLAITTEVVTEPVGDVLVDCAAKAQLVVVASMDVSASAAILLGSTTLTLATHAECPVVAWRGDHTGVTAGPIVAGVDKTPSGMEALAEAFRYADRFGVPLRVVHSWSLRRPPGDVSIPFMIDWDGLAAMERSSLQKVVDHHRAAYPRVDATCFLEFVGPGRALLKHLDGAQLVIVGNHRRNPVTAVLLGSTSLNMLHHSPIPVMVCHPKSES